MALYDEERRGGGASAKRWFDLKTPLGKDVLIVTGMVGEEGISRLFRFELTVVTERQSIKPTDLLGKGVTLKIACHYAGPGSEVEPDDPERRRAAQKKKQDPRERDDDPGAAGSEPDPARRLHGIVTRFWGGRILQNKLREYRIEVSPKLWILKRSSRYRVYQDKSAKDIVLKLLDDAGVVYKNNLTLTYDTREYCVQYGESDFDFLNRLIQEEGIFFYFTHEDDKHTLVLEDSKNWSSAKATDVHYNPGDGQLYDTVNAFEYGPGLIDREWLVTDYEFTTPDSEIKEKVTTDKAPSASEAWQHRLHGVGLIKKGGQSGKIESASAKRAATIDVDGAESGYETGLGRGTDPRFVPGLVVEVKEHSDTALDGRSFVLTEVRHDGIEPGRHTQSADTPKRPPYRNDFSCIPAKVSLPHPVPPQKPLARGPMTALVVGPSGSEIHTDEYGRIRVQFYWDLDGKKDDKSSCFVRVAQPWSGKNWGAVFIPRVGMEVVVQFLDGDPDRPLVTGTVYNGTNKPPWALPDKMTKSGILTRSTKDGAVADANELSFDDDKGKEMFLIHAQKDLTREIENDETITVGHDQISEVKNDRTTTIKQGKDTLTVETGDRTQTIKTGNDTLEVSTGNRAVTVKTGNHDLKLNLGNASTVCSTGKIALQAAQSVKLTCGTNTLELTPSGIALNGIQIALKANAMIDQKAPLINVKADGVTTIGGGIVKIN